MSAKSTIMSLNLLTTFVGNSFDAVVIKINFLNEFWTFLGFAILMLLTAVGFVYLASLYQIREFSRQEFGSKPSDIEMAEEASSLASNVDSVLLIPRTS